MRWLSNSMKTRFPLQSHSAQYHGLGKRRDSLSGEPRGPLFLPLPIPLHCSISLNKRLKMETLLLEFLGAGARWQCRKVSYDSYAFCPSCCLPLL